MATKISMFTELSSSDRPSWGLCITGSNENGARDPGSQHKLVCLNTEYLSGREVQSRQTVLISSQGHSPQGNLPSGSCGFGDILRSTLNLVSHETRKESKPSNSYYNFVLCRIFKALLNMG